MIFNAFEGIATESTLKAILRVVTYAKDINDRLQVSVVNQVPVSIYANNSSGSVGAANIVPFSTGSWNVTDVREEIMISQQQNFLISRSRWTF